MSINMKVQCTKCGEFFMSDTNISGYGICAKCLPQYLKDLDEIPKAGKIEDIPEKYKYMFNMNLFGQVVKTLKEENEDISTKEAKL